MAQVRYCCNGCYKKLIFILLAAQFTVISVYFSRNYTPESNRYTQLVAQQSTKSFTETNEKRVETIRRYCSRHKQTLTETYPSYERLKKSLPGYVWLASPAHELFYCATPKCASTTWKVYLLEDLGIVRLKHHHFVASQKLGIHNIHAFEEGNPQFMQFLEEYRPTNRLIIVRNPWARLVSAYEDKVVGEANSLEKMCIAWEKYPAQTATTFSLFIDCLINSPRNEIWNFHINPFTSLCGVCHMDYNIIAKLEEMAEAEPIIKQTLGFIETQNQYQPSQRGKYTNTYARYYRNLTNDQIKSLQDIYRHDIELFDYPLSPFD